MLNLRNLPFQYRLMYYGGVKKSFNREDALYMLSKVVEKYDLKKVSRKRELVFKRHYFNWFCYSNFMTKITLQKIGGLVGKDHASVLHSMKVSENLLLTRDSLFLQVIQEIDQDLNFICNELQGSIRTNAKQVLDKNKIRSHSKLA